MRFARGEGRLGYPLSLDYVTGRPVRSHLVPDVPDGLDAGLERDHVFTIDWFLDPGVLRRNLEAFCDPVLVDPAGGVREVDVVPPLHRREVEAWVKAFGAGPAEPVAGDVGVGVPLLPGETRIGELDGAQIQRGLRIVVPDRV